MVTTVSGPDVLHRLMWKARFMTLSDLYRDRERNFLVKKPLAHIDAKLQLHSTAFHLDRTIRLQNLQHAVREARSAEEKTTAQQALTALEDDFRGRELPCKIAESSDHHLFAMIPPCARCRSVYPYSYTQAKDLSPPVYRVAGCAEAEGSCYLDRYPHIK